ncbi:Transposase IS116/IS110/IS902 family [Arcanobacterium haemolyticum]|nr:Transposase IS116/IS110/IS902 family [Arcanobacterium haemolyticum]
MAQTWPVPRALTKAGRARIGAKLKKNGARRWQVWANEIIEALATQTVTVTGTSAAAVVIPHLATTLHELYKQRSDIESQIEDLVTEHPLFLVLTSMPGVGVRTAAVLIAEMAGKDFESAAHLASYAGLTPRTRQSGASIKSETVSHTGNKRLKRASSLLSHPYGQIPSPVGTTIRNALRGSTLLSLFEELTVERGKKGDLLLLDSQAGFVVCAMSEPETDGEAELGFGASHSLRIASERAITELQQIRSSITHGSTWADNGASTSGELDEYPNMKKLASRHFQLPKRGGETVEVPLNVEFTGSPVIQLRENGYVPLGRMIWSDTIDIGSIIVAQAVVPGLETLNNLIFNRPILPLGRLRSASSIDFLLKRK